MKSISNLWLIKQSQFSTVLPSTLSAPLCVCYCLLISPIFKHLSSSSSRVTFSLLCFLLSYICINVSSGGNRRMVSSRMDGEEKREIEYDGGGHQKRTEREEREEVSELNEFNRQRASGRVGGSRGDLDCWANSVTSREERKEHRTFFGLLLHLLPFFQSSSGWGS